MARKVWIARDQQEQYLGGFAGLEYNSPQLKNHL